MVLLEIPAAEILVKALESLILFRLVQLEVHSVENDHSACLIQPGSHRHLRHNILITAETEHLHTISRQSLSCIVGRRIGVTENGIPLREIRASKRDEGSGRCPIAVTGNEEDGILFGEPFHRQIISQFFHRVYSRIFKPVRLCLYVRNDVHNRRRSAVNCRHHIFAVYLLPASSKDHGRLVDHLRQFKIVMTNIRKSKLLQGLFSQVPCMFPYSTINDSGKDQPHDSKIQIRGIIRIVVVQIGEIPPGVHILKEPLLDLGILSCRIVFSGNVENRLFHVAAPFIDINCLLPEPGSLLSEIKNLAHIN